MATAAFICGMWAYSACDFNLRYVTLAQNQAVEEACANANILPPFDTLCEKTTGTHGIGFEGWWVQTDQLCYSYLQLAPNGLYVTPPFDTMFNSARALAITALVFGGAAWYVMFFFSCSVFFFVLLLYYCFVEMTHARTLTHIRPFLIAFLLYPLLFFFHYAGSR